MTIGELNDAKRRALNNLDAWNDVVGIVPKATGLYYELQSVIEDAVECGAQAACKVFQPLDGEEGDVVLNVSPSHQQEWLDKTQPAIGPTCRKCGVPLEFRKAGAVDCFKCSQCGYSAQVVYEEAKGE